MRKFAVYFDQINRERIVVSARTRERAVLKARSEWRLRHSSLPQEFVEEIDKEKEADDANIT